MIFYGCAVSQYPQFCDKYLDMYQVLPRPYIGSFDSFPGDKFIKKCVLDLAYQGDFFFWKCIDSKITIDNIDEEIPGQYWKILKEKIEKTK